MDAQAHLLSLGWAGPGHALDARPYQQKGHRGLAYDPKQVRSTGGGNGLVKPLLISQRQARLGVGKKAHEPQAGNEWWLKGFESALGNIGKSESERSSGVTTPDTTGAQQQGKHGGLYSFFVKGQEMEGTVGRSDDGDDGKKKSSSKKKRKSDALDDDEDVNTGDASEARDSLRRREKDPSVEFEQVGEYLAVRDKDKTSRLKKGKPSVLEEFQQINEFFAATTGSKKTKKKRKSEKFDAPEQVTVHNEQSENAETKEERRDRRRKRREEREAIMRLANAANTVAHRSEQTEDDEAAAAAAAAKAARKAERKRRKAATLNAVENGS